MCKHAAALCTLLLKGREINTFFFWKARVFTLFIRQLIYGSSSSSRRNPGVSAYITARPIFCFGWDNVGGGVWHLLRASKAYLDMVVSPKKNG